MKTLFKYLSYVIIIQGVLLGTAMAMAVDNPLQKNHSNSVQEAYHQLQSIRQKNNLIQAANEKFSQSLNEKTQALTPANVTKEKIERAELAIAIANANIDAATISKAEMRQKMDNTLAKIHNLETKLQDVTLAAGTTNSVSQRIAELRAALNTQRNLLKWQQRKVDAYSQRINLAKQNYQLQLNWKNALYKQYQNQQQLIRQQQLEKEELALQQQQRKWLERITTLNTQLQQQSITTNVNKTVQPNIELSIIQAQERSNLIHIKLIMLRLKSTIVNLEQSFQLPQTIYDLNNAIDKTATIDAELQGLTEMVQRKIALIKKRDKLQEESLQRNLINQATYDKHHKLLLSMEGQYQHQLSNIQLLKDMNADVTQQLQANLSKALSRRQGLPGFSIAAWSNLGHKLMDMPSLTLQMLNAFKDQISVSIEKSSPLKLLSIAGIEILLLLGLLWGRRNLSKLVARFKEDRRTITDNARFVLTKLLRCNLITIFVIGGASLCFWLLGVPVKAFTPIIWLAIVFLVFKIAIGLSRLVLIETSTDAEGKDVKLYQHLRWALLAGGLLTMLTVLAQQLPVSFEVRDFFNRLFSLFMLVVSILLLRNWSIVPYLLSPYVEGSRAYVMRTIKLLSFLVPVTILITALIGMFGYVDLAWTISKYEGQFLLVLAGYVLARGFLKDFVEWLSRLFIRKLRNGWLWIQAVLRPLDKILQVSLFVLAVAFLFYLYSWGEDSYAVQEITSFMKLHLMQLKGTVITPFSLIEFIITGFVLVWLSRWTREFSYRWLFARTADIGLRNSMAAFTQYITVIVGLLIALKIIGIDLSGIEYVLGGFAIAVGFGLRDLVKNYASGILLLFERPVRTGDLVSIGSFEGEVTRIGMRSMTVKTWDHMEVLVPNSETFDKPFTNWTHQDGIVRTVINLKFTRRDDPNLIREIIFDVIAKTPEIVTTPSPQVFMKELNESLIDLDVRYFINLQAGSSRVAVRSEVLYSLWEVFKANGIQPPYPQQDIHLKSMPAEGQIPTNH